MVPGKDKLNAMEDIKVNLRVFEAGDQNVSELQPYWRQAGAVILPLYSELLSLRTYLHVFRLIVSMNGN